MSYRCPEGFKEMAELPTSCLRSFIEHEGFEHSADANLHNGLLPCEVWIKRSKKGLALWSVLLPTDHDIELCKRDKDSITYTLCDIFHMPPCKLAKKIKKTAEDWRTDVNNNIIKRLDELLKVFAVTTDYDEDIGFLGITLSSDISPNYPINSETLRNLLMDIGMINTILNCWENDYIILRPSVWLTDPIVVHISIHPRN